MIIPAHEFVEESLLAAGLPCSEAAVALLVMVAAHESGGFRAVCQSGSGSARSLWQFEPVGFREVRRYVELRPERFVDWLRREILGRDFEYLRLDQRFACQCARVFFMAEPAPLPAFDDIDGLAEYAKLHWNTEAGRARAEDYATAYRGYLAERHPDNVREGT